MKVIITKETPKIGRKNEVKDFPDGYVRNFLLPKGIAVIATPENLKELEKNKERMRVEKEIKEDLLEKNLLELKDVTLTMERKANEQGHLFSSIHEDDISLELSKSLRILVDSKTIKIDSPIKEVGTKKIKVEVGNKQSFFTLEIKPLK